MKEYFSLGLLMMTGACAIGSPESSPGEPDASPASPSAETKGVTITNEETGEEVLPLETLTFEGGSQVAFFEPTAGDLFVATFGPNGAPPPIDKDLEGEELLPVDLYERLSGKQAPLRLLDAQARALELEAVQGPARGDSRVQSSSQRPEARTEGGEDVRPKTSEAQLFDCKGTFSYDEWFNCNYCQGVGDFDYTWMWSTGNGSFQRNDVRTYWTTVSVYAGTPLNFRIRHRPWYSWSTRVSVNVAAGYYYAGSARNSTDYDLEVKTSDASGSSYHWCSNGWR